MKKGERILVFLLGVPFMITSIEVFFFLHRSSPPSPHPALSTAAEILFSSVIMVIGISFCLWGITGRDWLGNLVVKYL